MPSTQTIGALTAGLAVNLDDTALFPVRDKNAADRKYTVAQVRTQIATGLVLTTAAQPNVTSATTLTASSIDSGGAVFNTRAFGTIGDGVADDTTALNNAFATPNARIYVPQGSYKVSSTLSQPKCAAIVGAGRNQANNTVTRFVPTSAVTLFLGLFSAPTVGPTLLQDFWVD